MDINIPLFRDTNTLEVEHITPNYETKANGHSNGHPKPDEAHGHQNGNGEVHQNGHLNGASSHEKPYNIYMDAMGFGMGACCLQVS